MILQTEDNYEAGSQVKPEDRVLFCPHCGVQHIDFAEPDKCETCGHSKKHHFNAGETNFCGYASRPVQALTDTLECPCDGFEPWLNPPHKKHRCKPEEGGCGELFKPEDYPTNGVKSLPDKTDAALNELFEKAHSQVSGEEKDA